MHTWTSSPFASTAGNRAVGECSSIACWKMPSQHSQRDIGLQEPTKQHQNTTCSGYCTKAATPLQGFTKNSVLNTGTLGFGSPYRESTTYGFLCLFPRHRSPLVPVSAVDSFLPHGKSAGKIFFYG